MKKKIIYMIILGFSTPFAFSGTMGDVSTTPLSTFYLLAGSGASFPNAAKLSVDTNFWSPSPNGFNSSLGAAPLYTAGIGYFWNDVINIDLTYAYRGIYKYNHFQTPSPPSASVPEPLNASRTRYFTLASNSILFNTTLLGKGYNNQLSYEVTNMGFIQPFLGAGIGISYNVIDNFHTILNNTTYSTSVMLNHIQPSLAYQLNAGLEWKYDRFAFDIGYRYFYAGGYSSNSYLITNMSTSGSPVETEQLPPWKGVLSANEIFVTAKILF